MRNLPVEFHNEEVYGVFIDCMETVPASGVATLGAFVPTYAVGDISESDLTGGVYLFTWTVADEEFISLLTAAELFEFISGKPIRFAAQLTPGLTADTPEELNIFIGCMENMDTATEMQATGLGPRADSDMFGFFTVESVSAAYANPELWHCVSSFGALQTITPLIATNPNNLSGQDQKVFDGDGNGIRRKFHAEWVPVNLVPGVAGLVPTLLDAEVRFWLDDKLVAKHQMRGAFQITIAGTEPMNFGIVGSNAAASSATAALNLDYLKCDQAR